MTLGDRILITANPTFPNTKQDLNWNKSPSVRIGEQEYFWSLDIQFLVCASL